MRVGEALHVLGVSPSATSAEIKAAFRRHVKSSHPDRHGTDAPRRARAEDELRRVIAAYECLRNGIPPPESEPEPEHGKSGTASDSLISIRQPPPPDSHWRRSSRNTVDDRLSWTERLLWGLLVAPVAFGILLGVLALAPTPTSPDVDRFVRWVPHPGSATRIGRDWEVHNPSEEAWRYCRAWVGDKVFQFYGVEPRTRRTLPAAEFRPSLTPDDAEELRLECLSR